MADLPKREWATSRWPLGRDRRPLELTLPMRMSEAEWEQVMEYMAVMKRAVVSPYEFWPDAIGDGAIRLVGGR